MLTVHEIIEKLEDRNLTEVSRKTDIPYNALWYFFKNKGGARADLQMVEKLSDYLEGNHKKAEGE